MKKIVFVLFILPFFAIAQKKNLTMTEAVNGMSTTLAVSNLKQLQWMGNTDYYSYVINNDSAKVIMAYSPVTFDSQPILSLDNMNKLLMDIKVPPLTSIPTIHWLSNSSFYINSENKYIQFNKTFEDWFSADVIATLPDTTKDEMLCEKNMQIAYTASNNLFIHAKHGCVVQLTQDGSEDIVYGHSVHREEFGITKGLFWSPSGDKLAFYRMDQSMVENYPIVNWGVTPAVVKNIKYPMAGRNSHHVTLGVYDTKSTRLFYLQTGEPADQYLTSVTWSPDEKYIYVALLNRDQNHLKLNQYDAVNGEFVKTLLEEENEKYVEPQHELYFIHEDANQFVWWSQRDGFMHLYLYKTDGTLIKQLTKGNWVVNEILGFNKKSQEIIYTSSEASPMQKNVYAVNMNTANMRRISTTLATHTAALSKSGTFLIDAFTSEKIPRNIEITNVITKQEKRLLTASNPLENYQLSTVQLVHLYADDSTLLYGKLMLPYNFDSTKKYPVIVYLYNGPHVQLNKDAFPYSGNLWYDYMTEKGYIVFVMDGRGSWNRGFAFESIIHRQLGTVEMKDQMLGVDYLKSLAFVDTNRLGIHGWSYGGFMTTSFMLRQPSVFKCGVAGGPVLDWSMYEIMYGERYMDTPQQNPAGYKANVLLDKVKNLKGKLRLIHGTDDDVVVWEHSIKLIKKSVDEGIQLDYFVYPGHPHNVRGKDRVHLMQKITNYFDSNL